MLPKPSTSSMNSENVASGVSVKTLQPITSECSTGGSHENGTSLSLHGSENGIANSNPLPNETSKTKPTLTSNPTRIKNFVRRNCDKEIDEVDDIGNSSANYTYQNGDAASASDCNGLPSTKYTSDEPNEDSDLALVSHKNLIRKKRFLENSLNNEVSPSYSQSFDCSSKLPSSSQTGIRKKESLRNNRPYSSVDYRTDSNSLSLEDTHSSTESVGDERSNAVRYELAIRCDNDASSSNDNSLPGNSSDDCEVSALKKPFKLPSLVNLFEAAKAQQRIDLAENASALSEAAAASLDRELDETPGLELEPGSSYSSDGSNSDTESQRMAKPRENVGCTKV